MMRDEIKEEVERQLRERDGSRRSRKAVVFALVLALFGGRLAWAQANVGGSHQMSDLFRRFFTWDATSVSLVSPLGFVVRTGAATVTSIGTVGTEFFGVTSTAINAGAGAVGITVNTGSGSNGIGIATNGARIDFGSGADDYMSSNGTTITTPAIFQALDLQVDTARAVYLNGSTRTIGFMNQTNTTNRLSVLGVVPLTPTTDQAINLGDPSFRWSNAYFGGQIFNTRSTGTPASGTGVTATYTSMIGNWTSRITVTSAAMTAAGTTDITLMVTPVNTRIIRLTANGTTTFSGGALANVTVACGNTAGGNQYLLGGAQCDIGVTETPACGDVVADIGAALLTATWADMGTPSAGGVPGAITVQCRFTCTGANCNAATQGTVSFYVEGVTY